MDEYKKIKADAEKIYQKIGSLFCSLLGDKVHFTRESFDHLIRKDGKLRTKREQIERLRLVSILIESVTDNKADVHFDDTKEVRYWTMIPSRYRSVRIVITENSLKQKIFLSIYPYTKNPTH